jgi:hypothetical protein
MGNRYARVAGGGQVYLLPDSVIGDMMSAQYKFMRKELHDFALADVDEVRLEAVGTSRRLLQRNRRTPESAMWVDAARPDRRNQLYGNWLGQVVKLTAQKYLAPGAEPGSELEVKAGELEELMAIEYFAARKSLGKMSMARVTADNAYYYARTEKTHTWVEVPRSVAKLVAQDVAMVAGGQEQPEQPGDPSKLPGEPAPPAGQPKPAGSPPPSPRP